MRVVVKPGLRAGEGFGAVRSEEYGQGCRW